MRFPYRVVGDYHVDRPQVYRQKCQSRAVLIARRLQYEKISASLSFSRRHTRNSAIRYNSGGNSNGDPPLPIPNREVKPVHAYDTAIPSGKVGSRQLQEPQHENAGALFVGGLSRFFYATSWRLAPFSRGTSCLIYRQGVPDGGAWCVLWLGHQAIAQSSRGLRIAGCQELSSP